MLHSHWSVWFYMIFLNLYLYNKVFICSKASCFQAINIEFYRIKKYCFAYARFYVMLIVVVLFVLQNNRPCPWFNPKALCIKKLLIDILSIYLYITIIIMLLGKPSVLNTNHITIFLNVLSKLLKSWFGIT